MSHCWVKFWAVACEQSQIWIQNREERERTKYVFASESCPTAFAIDAKARIPSIPLMARLVMLGLDRLSTCLDHPSLERTEGRKKRGHVLINWVQRS